MRSRCWPPACTSGVAAGRRRPAGLPARVCTTGLPGRPLPPGGSGRPAQQGLQLHQNVAVPLRADDSDNSPLPGHIDIDHLHRGFLSNEIPGFSWLDAWLAQGGFISTQHACANPGFFDGHGYCEAGSAGCPAGRSQRSVESGIPGRMRRVDASASSMPGVPSLPGGVDPSGYSYLIGWEAGLRAAAKNLGVWQDGAANRCFRVVDGDRLTTFDRLSNTGEL